MSKRPGAGRAAGLRAWFPRPSGSGGRCGCWLRARPGGHQERVSGPRVGLCAGKPLGALALDAFQALGTARVDSGNGGRDGEGRAPGTRGRSERPLGRTQACALPAAASSLGLRGLGQLLKVVGRDDK
ncbi:uncharacterized protein LOC116456953 [Hylobates moloch]|uniref:uncharacterized protein LOC116456953 n=1 Tax=Hylobates moloch TaxID=81572 RepID=UPI0026775E5F|nr:uncharacterized protein LOC116456953 [Hylobates moloch]